MTYNVVKDGKAENHAGTFETSKLLLLISLQTKLVKELL